eukprot:m.11994 g.11994  ORF g.11994 m.11994 type:complete len:405 (+) comp16971_c0_seq1:89-1303(+)
MQASRAALVEFCRQLSTAVDRSFGVQCARLLSLRAKSETAFASMLTQPAHQIKTLTTNTTTEILSFSGFNEIAAHHVAAYLALRQENFQDAFEAQVAVVEAFLKFFSKDKGNWILDVMRVLAIELRLIARLVDDMNKDSEPVAKNTTLGKLRDCFTAITNDRSTGETSKRCGMLMVVNQVLCVSFQVTNFALTASLLRTVDQAQEFKTSAVMGDRVTYSYYLGRLKMFDGDYATADSELSFAFRHCHKRAMNNKRLILIYLLPVKLMRGQIPHESMLVKYRLPEFTALVQAVKEGHLSKFLQALSEHQLFFIQWGIFLILERLRIVCYRNLFKKVHRIIGLTNIKLGAFLTALRFTHEEDVDLDEVECIVANLIFQKQIKGYIAHDKKVLVVAKTDAFPSPQSL